MGLQFDIFILSSFLDKCWISENFNLKGNHFITNLSKGDAIDDMLDFRIFVDINCFCH